MSFNMHAVTDLCDQMARQKSLFEAYIADTSFPLEKRWDTFLLAPSWLRNHGGWATRILDDIISGICWYDDFNCERHQVVKMEYVIEMMEESLEYNEDSRYTAEQITACKEAILKANLGSFEYDW